MDGRQRWWAAGAIAFALLFVATAALVGDFGESAAALADHADRLLAAFVTSVLASLAAIVFFAGLREESRASRTGASLLPTMAFGSAVAGAAVLPGSLALLFGAAEAGDALSDDVAQFAGHAQYPFLVAAMMFLGAAVALSCLDLRHSAAAPRWLAWSGIVAGALQLLALAFLPMLLLVLWLLVAGVVLLTRRTAPAA